MKPPGRDLVPSVRHERVEPQRVEKCKPDLLCESAAKNKVANRFGFLGTQGALITILESMALMSLRRPQLLV
jgi:hypothetical protein